MREPHQETENICSPPHHLTPFPGTPLRCSIRAQSHAGYVRHNLVHDPDYDQELSRRTNAVLYLKLHEGAQR